MSVESEPKTKKWEPCNPLHTYPANKRAIKSRLTAGAIAEITVHLIARGVEQADVYDIIYSHNISKQGKYDRIQQILDAHDGVARARLGYIRTKLGTIASDNGCSRDNLVQSLADRLRHCKHDRDYIQGVAVLARICGYEAPTTSIQVNAQASMDDFASKLRDRLKLVPPRPVLPAQVVDSKPVNSDLPADGDK